MAHVLCCKYGLNIVYILFVNIFTQKVGNEKRNGRQIVFHVKTAHISVCSRSLIDHLSAITVNC